MNELVKADVFFFITSLSVLLLTFASLVVVYFLIRILRNVDAVMIRLREESAHIADGFHDLHETVEAGGSRVMDMIRIVGGLYKSSARRRTSQHTKSKSSETSDSAEKNRSHAKRSS